MDDYITIFTESNEDLGLQLDSYEPILATVNNFLDDVEKCIKEMNRGKSKLSIDLTARIKSFKTDVKKSIKPESIEIGRVPSYKKRVRTFQVALDRTLTRFSKLKDSVAYGGNYIRAIIRKPKVYSREIDTDKYEVNNSNIRAVNRALDWSEKVMIDLFNLADQDMNILTIIDRVYKKNHIYEDVMTETDADIVQMLPEGSARYLANSHDKKTSTVPPYIKNNHSMATYGEEEPIEDDEKEKTLDDYRRPSAPKDENDDKEEIKPYDGPTGTEEQPASAPKPDNGADEKRAIQNYYYYTYHNSNNRTVKDDHSVHTRDDHSTNDSYNQREADKRKNEDFHSVESASVLTESTAWKRQIHQTSSQLTDCMKNVLSIYKQAAETDDPAKEKEKLDQAWKIIEKMQDISDKSRHMMATIGLRDVEEDPESKEIMKEMDKISDEIFEMFKDKKLIKNVVIKDLYRKANQFNALSKKIKLVIAKDGEKKFEEAAKPWELNLGIPEPIMEGHFGNFENPERRIEDPTRFAKSKLAQLAAKTPRYLTDEELDEPLAKNIDARKIFADLFADDYKTEGFDDDEMARLRGEYQDLVIKRDNLSKQLATVIEFPTPNMKNDAEERNSLSEQLSMVDADLIKKYKEIRDLRLKAVGESANPESEANIQKYIAEQLDKDCDELGEISEAATKDMSEHFKEACFWSSCDYGVEKLYDTWDAVLAAIGNYDYECDGEDSNALFEEMRSDLHKYAEVVSKGVKEKFGDKYEVVVESEEGETLDAFIDNMKAYVEKTGRHASDSVTVIARATDAYVKSITPDEATAANAKLEKYKQAMRKVLKWINKPAIDNDGYVVYYLFPVCKALGISKDELDSKVSSNIDTSKFGSLTGLVGEDFSDSEWGIKHFNEEYGPVIIFGGYDDYLVYSPKKKAVVVLNFEHNEIYDVNDHDFTNDFSSDIASKLKEYYNEIKSNPALLESVMTEEVGDADDMKPKSDHPVRDALMDIDRATTKTQQKAKKAVQNLQNAGRAAMKPVNRTKQWIGNMVSQWKDADETNIKEKLADPHSRRNLYTAIKTAIEAGALWKAGILFNPLFLFLAITRKVGQHKREYRIRNEMIGELKTEMNIIQEKIGDAERAGDNKAKYELMRLKNELNKKLMRVAGNTTGVNKWSKTI